MIEAVIFDIGNVLVSFDWTIARQRLKEQFGRKADLWESEDFVAVAEAYGVGAIETDQFLKLGCDHLGIPGKAKELADAWCQIFSPNHAIDRLVRDLAAHYPLYLLSNTNELHWNFLRTEYPVLRVFKDQVLSFQARSAKPDPEIFGIALRQFGLEPAKVLFVDDLMPNVEAARGLGFQSVQYSAQGHEDLCRLARGRK